MTPVAGVARSQNHSQGQGQQGAQGLAGAKYLGLLGLPLASGLPHLEVPALGSPLGGPFLSQLPLSPAVVFLPNPVAPPGEEGGWEPAGSAAQCVYEMFHFLFLTGPAFRDHRATS